MPGIARTGAGGEHRGHEGSLPVDAKHRQRRVAELLRQIQIPGTSGNGELVRSGAWFFRLRFPGARRCAQPRYTQNHHVDAPVLRPAFRRII